MLEIRSLPKDLQKVAIDELNEVPERLADDVAALRSWIDKEPHLKARSDDQFLVAFLRGCKFSLEKAKSKIDKYYSLRTRLPESFTMRDLDEERLLELIRIGTALQLPTPLNENGPRILLMRPGHYPVDKYNFSEFTRLSHILQSLTIITDDYANVNGVIAIVDMGELTAQHMFQMTPSLVKRTSTYIEYAIPIRQRGTHIINTPAGWEPIFNTIKPLMPMKQQKRIYIHGNKMESLYEHIPQKYLPKEYGGENGTIPEIIAATEARYNKYRDYLREDLNYGTDERLRVGQLEDFGLFGAEGSFRQLNVD